MIRDWGIEGLPILRDSDAEITLLTGPSWAYCIQQALRNAKHSILLSIYLLSPHWKKQGPGATNLLTEMCNAGQRLASTSGTCRVVMGQPGRGGVTARYNQEAAARLANSGWGVRMMKHGVTLHEKIWIIDDLLTVIGSHNVSRSSAASNLDTSIAIYSKIVASALRSIWWNRWNMAEQYKAVEAEYGENNRYEHTDRPAKRLWEPYQPARRKII